MAAPLDPSSISCDVRLPPKGGRKAAVTSCPGYNSLGQLGDKARSTPLEVQRARGGGWTCEHGLMASPLGTPRVHGKRGVRIVSKPRERDDGGLDAGKTVQCHSTATRCLSLNYLRGWFMLSSALIRDFSQAPEYFPYAPLGHRQLDRKRWTSP